MSTILDALKKSEQERKLNKLPTLTDTRAPREPSRWPVILAVISAAIALLAIALAVYWWQATGESVARPPVAAASAPQTGLPATDTDGINQDGVVINMVSYSDQLSRRFAMINGKMVREGEFVEAGLMVERINVDSVVLNLRGRRITRKP